MNGGRSLPLPTSVVTSACHLSLSDAYLSIVDSNIFWEEWGKGTNSKPDQGGSDNGNQGGNDGDQGENPLG